MNEIIPTFTVRYIVAHNSATIESNSLHKEANDKLDEFNS